MKYRTIVFFQEEESSHDNGIVQDEALRILHHKPTDPCDPEYGSIVWEIPNAEDVRKTLDYMLQWDNADAGEIRDYEPWGGADELIRTRRGRGGPTFVISYNVGLSTIALTELIPDGRRQLRS